MPEEQGARASLEELTRELGRRWHHALASCLCTTCKCAYARFESWVALNGTGRNICGYGLAADMSSSSVRGKSINYIGFTCSNQVGGPHFADTGLLMGLQWLGHVVGPFSVHHKLMAWNREPYRTARDGAEQLLTSLSPFSGVHSKCTTCARVDLVRRVSPARAGVSSELSSVGLVHERDPGDSTPQQRVGEIQHVVFESTRGARGFEARDRETLSTRLVPS